MTNNISNHEMNPFNKMNVSIESCKKGLTAICIIGIVTSLLELFGGLVCMGTGVYNLAGGSVLSPLPSDETVILGLVLLVTGLFSMSKNIFGLKGMQTPSLLTPALVMGVIAAVLSGGNLITVLTDHYQLAPMISMVCTFVLNCLFCFCVAKIRTSNKAVKAVAK